MTTILDLPDIAGWQEVTFDPVRPRSIERMLDRRTEGLSQGTPFWVAHYTTPYLTLDEYGKLDAFMMRAGDGGEVFRAYDAFRPRPIRHDTGKPLTGVRAGGGAFDGTATLAAIVDAHTITVSTLPEAFALSQGDYVELREDGEQSLHRIMQAATANGDGIVSLSIRYALDTGVFSTAAQVRFEKPSCLMQIDPGSYKGPKSRRNRTVSFGATEVFVA